MLQCGVVYCSVVCSVLQCTALRCSVLQHIVLCCSVLQRVAACCSVLQRFIVYYSVLQSVSSIMLQHMRKTSAHFCEFVFLQRCVCVVFVMCVRFLSRTGVGADVCNALLIS